MAILLQFAFRKYDYRVSVTIGFLLLCLFFVGLFCLLGVWQLHRYHYKQQLQINYTHRIHGKAVDFSVIDKNNLPPFQRMMVRGQFVNSLSMLVQNQFYRGQQGFEVLTPMRVPGDKKLLLVDRGWVPASRVGGNKQWMTDFTMQPISGYAKMLDEYQFILGKNILFPDQMPIVMQKIDIKELTHITHQAFYSFILRLDASQPNGFVRDWIVTAVQPERHLGYALQWFLMALVLSVVYLCYCIERVKRDELCQ